MITIRTENPQDYEAIRELNNEAFGMENEANLIEAIRNSTYFIKELSLVAETNKKEIVGHILFSKVTIETVHGPIVSLALAPMAVKLKFQNKGIGSSLVKEGLQVSEKLGYSSVIVLGHPSFYPKFGFVPAVSKGIRPPFNVSDDVFMVYEVKEHALENVNGIVKYPDAFSNV